ncbi:MAG: HU family DNA-binding protein [Gemmatales bacterium]|nr:HU family DNA-binding protein [Gemmatales bacterium]MDW8387065.1 HU family DNA-binding protein [Gemmatales bacterium]
MAKKAKGKTDTAKSSKPATKSEILNALSQATGLKRKQIADFFDKLHLLVVGHLKQNQGGVFALPGLLKFKLVHKPAVPAREGRNPFTGEIMMFKAKPARKLVKAQPLKQLKEMV